MLLILKQNFAYDIVYLFKLYVKLYWNFVRNTSTEGLDITIINTISASF